MDLGGSLMLEQINQIKSFFLSAPYGPNGRFNLKSHMDAKLISFILR
jgi:hypothetical protein